ncbi:ABC transporter permease [Ideonella sp. DXS22W]|uniref:ABC transporter permease n=1 Tax=Pseudaquabacterium inlustre TaxID=2984192 RepID=A0ABU9CNE6_9BURK
MASWKKYALGWLWLFSGATTWAQSGACGNPFQNHFGPFDYRSAKHSDLHMVERVHFTPGIESLSKPNTTTLTHIAGDITYTLHVFPNHHRALAAMARLAQQRQTDQPPSARYSVNCYFERALTFRPDDNVARMLYAQYLISTKHNSLALAHVRHVQKLAPDSAMTQRNVALLALELGELQLARQAAERAAELGDRDVTLVQRLQAAGAAPATAEAIATQGSAAQ